MKTVNMHETKTNLSRLVAEVENGESFLIAKAGKPVAKVVPYVPTNPRRFGSLRGVYKVPDDIDTPFKEDIEKMFYGSSPPQFKTEG